MNKKGDICPICQMENIVIEDYDIKKDIKLIKCNRCKKFLADGKLVSYDQYTKEWWKKKHIISAIICELNIQNMKIPVIDSEKIEEMLLTYPKIPKSPKEQADKLLFLLSKKYESISKGISFNYKIDYPLCYGENENDLYYFISYLEENGYIKHPPRGSESWVITVDGWEYFEKIKKGIDSKQIFIAIWFAKKMDEIFINGYKVVLEEFGFNPIHMKFLQHNKKIDNRIIAEIRKSRFLIADVTGMRHNVLFEAGFALGLDIPVIWTCKKRYFKDVEKIFDTRQYNYIKWKNIEELKKELKDRIEGTIPDLPKK